MGDDLVELSEPMTLMRTKDVKHLLDRIEELEAERDDYAFKWAEANNTYSEMHVALSEANDKLAKAVEERDEALNQLDSARHSIGVLEKRVKTFCDGWGIADKGRIEAEAKLATCEKYRDAYAEMDRIGTEAYRDLEAKLEKVVKVLETIVDQNGYADDPWGIARTTLAELKGEKVD